MRIIILLSILIFSSSPAVAGWEAFLTGVLDAQTKQMEKERKKKELEKSSGVNKGELKELNMSMDDFTDCLDRIELDPKYDIFDIKSPSPLSYNDFINTDFVTASEKESVSWFAYRLENCYMSSGFEDQDPKSYAAYELYNVISNAYLKQLILLAKLNNKAVSWGEFNYEINELTIDLTDRISEVYRTVEEKYNRSVNAMILAEQKDMIKRQSNALSRMMNDNNYFQSRLRDLEIEVEMSDIN